MRISGNESVHNFNITMNTQRKETDRTAAAVVEKIQQDTQIQQDAQIQQNTQAQQNTQSVVPTSIDGTQEDVKTAGESTAKAPKNSDPNDFTFDFKKNEFNLVGATSKLEDIDVEKAMSDMKKETVLDQYKYFVDFTNMGTDEDGTVRPVKRG